MSLGVSAYAMVVVHSKIWWNLTCFFFDVFRLKHTRTVFGTLFVCLGALLTDNILRLSKNPFPKCVFETSQG